jgi:helicase MOV-10
MFACTESTNWALNWCHLPNKRFPVIFHPSYGDHHNDNTSLFNSEEIVTIEQYIKLLLTFGINRRDIQQTDIGIISPYKRQCQKLMSKCLDNKWTRIEIGTVEAFQGREKPIIFISTVRSNTKHVGFLNNSKVRSRSLE